MNIDNQRVSALRPAGLIGLSVLLCGRALAQESDDSIDQHHDIEEIVVEATALARTVQQLSQPTAVLRGEELAKKMAPSIGETLSSELGVSSTFFGPVASRPVIRGQFGERVRVLTNGLDALDASALSEDHQTAVEGILADRVEIVRGPATLLYGSGAAGGLVNVVDTRIIEAPLEKPISGKIAFNADDAVGEEAAAGYVAFGTENIGFHLDYFRRDTDDYEIPGFAESARLRALEAGEGEEAEEEERGIVENSSSTTEGGAAAVTWVGDSGFVGVSVSQFESNYGVPGGHEHAEEEEPLPGMAEEEEETVRIDLDQRRIDVKGDFAFDGFIEGIRFRLADNDYEHTELEGGEVGTVFETDGFDGRAELRHRATNGFEGVVGVQYKQIDFNAIGDEAYVPGSDTRRSSLFAFEEYAVNDSLTLQGSLRIERQTIDGPTLAVDYDDDAFGASLGAVWYVDDRLTLSAHYSSTERHPNATELYAEGTHVAVQRFERGSVTLGQGILDKEHSNNLDLTFRGNTDRIDWTLTLFNNDVDDYVVLAPTPDIEDGFQVFEFGQVDAELYGYEAEARVELVDLNNGHIHGRLFSDYVHGEETRSGDYLPRLPPLRYGFGLHYTVGDAEFAVEAIAHEKQSKTAENELPTDSYTLVNAEFSYSLDDEGLFLFLRGRNLGDEDARQHSSPLKDLVPMPGRSLHAGIRFEF